MRFVRYRNPPLTNISASNLYWSSAQDLSIENRANGKKQVRRPIYQLNEDREIIKKWDSVNEAGEYYECTSHAVRGAINKNKKCKGFYWSYCDIYDGDDPNMRWKYYKVIGYSTIKISDTGIVKSKNGRLRNPILQSGYPSIGLVPDNSNYLPMEFGIHRIVCEAFIQKPDKYKELPFNKLRVNHFDGNKQNNYYKNLEWSTSSDNTRHAIANGLHPTLTGCIPVEQITKKGAIISTYKDAKEASEITGIKESYIVRVCSGERKSTNGKRFRYSK